MTYSTRDSAAIAARRALKKLHGDAYKAKAGVDFTLARDTASAMWTFDLINARGHAADAAERDDLDAPDLTAEQMDAWAAKQAAAKIAADARKMIADHDAEEDAADEADRIAAAKAAAKLRKPMGKRAAAQAAAEAGNLPPAPDFSAPTHARFRAKLATIVAAAEAGDIAALKAFEINPISSSPKAMAKYRDLAVTALEARAARA